MEKRNMTGRPIHIRAVLFRLEPTTALLKIGKDLISKDLRLGMNSRSDSDTVGQELRNCEFIREDDLDVIISAPEIMHRRADADLIHGAAQKMKVPADTILFLSRDGVHTFGGWQQLVDSDQPAVQKFLEMADHGPRDPVGI